MDPTVAVIAMAVADAGATGLAVLIAAGGAVDVAEIAVDAGATVVHAETAVAADLAGESVASTANADQAHHLDRFRT